MLGSYFRNENNPATFRIALLVDQALSKSTATITDGMQIVTGGGYTRVNGATGLAITRDGNGWDAIAQFLSTNVFYARMADAKWVASGHIPTSGNYARWLAICDAATPNNIIAIIDLGNLTDIPTSKEFAVENITMPLFNF